MYIIYTVDFENGFCCEEIRKMRRMFPIKKLVIVSLGALITLFLFYLLMDYLLHKKIPVPYKVAEEGLKALAGASLLFLTQLYFEKKEQVKYKPQLKIFFREIIDMANQGIELVKAIELIGLNNSKKLNARQAEERHKLERIKNEMHRKLSSKLNEIVDTPQAFKRVSDGLIDSVYDLNKILQNNLHDGIQNFTIELTTLSTKILEIIKGESAALIGDKNAIKERKNYRSS